MIFKEAKEENIGKVFEPIEQKEEKVLKEEIKKEVKKVEEKEAEAKVSVNLRLQPSLDADILCTLFTGIKVKVKDYNSTWYSLTYQGRDVFVMKEFIKIL